MTIKILANAHGKINLMTTKNTEYNAPILFKAFTILEEIAHDRAALGISELADRLSISKSTIYGITQALTEIGALRHDAVTKKFSLGPTLLKLGNQALARVDIRFILRSYMDKLSEEFNETVFMGTFNEYGITVTEKSDSPQGLKITAPIGARIPIFAGAAGKVFLANIKEQALNRILEESSLPKFTENSINDPEEYRKELEKVRREGFATDFGEYIQGVNGISVPLLSSGGWAVAALWMMGFSHTLTGVKIERAIAAASKVAVNLGWRQHSY